jgi:hypothetical protein
MRGRIYYNRLAAMFGVTSRDAVRFVITSARGGSMGLSVRPQPAKRNVQASVMPRIAKTVTAGIRSLEQTARRPKHFSDMALMKLRDLARLTDPETAAVARPATKRKRA